MKIAITQEIIDRSEPINGQRCVLANAVNAVLKPGLRSFFCKAFWQIQTDEDTYARALTTLSITDEARDIIREFDRGHKIEPCEVRLDIPEQFLEVK